MTEHDSSTQPQPAPPHDVPLPDPTLLDLLSGLSAQAMVSLGMFPSPTGESGRILLHQGKHLIDTIAMLDEKTRGHQTEIETQTFANLLHELRMIFVAAQTEQQRREASAQGAENRDQV